MPAVAPLPPEAIRELLEAHGYEVIREDPYNWSFAKGKDDEPILIPYRVDLVPLEVAFSVARKVGFNDYFEKLDVVTEHAPGKDPSVH